MMAVLPERGWATRHSQADLTGKPALFLDRDGTVIENVPYLDDPARIFLVPGAREAIAAFRASGHAVIIVTNQSGVARGLMSPERYHAVEAAMIEALGQGLVDATYACPFLDHPWRKPAPGMLLAAALDHGVVLAESTMIGDTLADLQAGAGAGVARVVHVLTGHGAVERAAVETWVGTGGGNDLPHACFAESLGDLFMRTVEARATFFEKSFRRIL